MAHPDGIRRRGSDVERATIEEHLRAHAGRYWAEAVGDLEVALLRLRIRPTARLYWYRVAGPGPGRTIVVKVPGGPADRAAGGGSVRPRLVEPPPLDVKYAREHAALDLLQRHFSGLDDPRFGAVPLLDRIDSARALVMGEVEGRPLKELSPQLARIHPGRPSPLLRRAVRNAGAWLRAYHRLQLGGATAWQARREDFAADARRFCDHLGAALSRPAFFDGLAERLTAATRRILPEELPLGLGHGDFAMRNVLVGREGRVVVLDTTAVWRTPVYGDLAKFGLATRLSRVQVYSHGGAFRETTLQEADRWLFEGYFGSEPVPEEAIGLYALLLLLDKWSFELALPPRGPRIARMARRWLLNAWYTRQAQRMVAWLT